MLDKAKAAVDQGPLSPAAVKALKIAIVVMGIMIIIGMALVIGRIIYLVSKPAATTGHVPAAAFRHLSSSLSLPLPAGATVLDVALDGPRIAVTYKNLNNSNIAIFNLETGEKITGIRLQTKAPAAHSVPQGE